MISRRIANHFWRVPQIESAVNSNEETLVMRFFCCSALIRMMKLFPQWLRDSGNNIFYNTLWCLKPLTWKRKENFSELFQLRFSSVFFLFETSLFRREHRALGGPRIDNKLLMGKAFVRRRFLSIPNPDIKFAIYFKVFIILLIILFETRRVV